MRINAKFLLPRLSSTTTGLYGLMENDRLLALDYINKRMGVFYLCNVERN